jgi:hypothetical protein
VGAAGGVGKGAGENFTPSNKINDKIGLISNKINDKIGVW